jgi:CheY-like chemotaxis protein/HPt (histidine-containing phosphotransfer) domain-containing protein
VSSGEEAVRQIAAADRTDPYQLVLMDLQMPNLDGLQATAIIRRESRLINAPRIILVTAFGREEIVAQAHDLDIDGYLLKPVSSSTLYDKLVELFGVVAGDPLGPGSKRELPTEYRAKGVRILLVEDNEMNQQIAQELLESEGASVTVAGHGGIAVKMLRDGPNPPPFDIVLMDIQMPEMDGHTATKLLRADGRFQELPIVAMTAHALVEERQRCMEAGMNDQVTKPIDPDALFAALRRWTKPREPDAAPLTPKASEAQRIPLPEFEGINVADGLNRVAGNRRLYRSLLEQFCEKQASTGQQIAAAIQAGDQELAGRLAHTLKGVAGNLGMAGVQQAAAKVERAIRVEDGSVSGLLAELNSVIGAQVASVRREWEGAEQTERAVPAGRLDEDAAAAAVADLRSLIDSNDGEAADAADRLAEGLAGSVDTQQVAQLRSALSEFDFEKAAAVLDAIVGSCAALPRQSKALSINS